MILADKIINERKKLGWSQEELADKLDVSRQSVSKWESAQSVPDLNRILKMAEVFGVSTDYLLKDEIEDKSGEEIKTDSYETKDEVRAVSMEEASTYLDVVEKTTPKIAFGVTLCIASPVVLIALATLAELKQISEYLAVGIGVGVLLFMVASAVLIFIMNGRHLEQYEYLEKETIDTAYGVDGMVKELKNKNERRNTLNIAFGVILCILSPIPLIAGSLYYEAIGQEDVGTFFVSILLVMVAIGVNLIINGAARNGAYQKLLQEGDYTIEGKKFSNKTGKIASIYWPLVVVIFFVWSFTTNAWNATWIIWPIAGVLFGAICGVLKVFSK